MELLRNLLIIGILSLLGGLPTIYLTISLPIMLGYKLFRKIKYGSSFYD